MIIAHSIFKIRALQLANFFLCNYYAYFLLVALYSEANSIDELLCMRETEYVEDEELFVSDNHNSEHYCDSELFAQIIL